MKRSGVSIVVSLAALMVAVSCGTNGTETRPAVLGAANTPGPARAMNGRPAAGTLFERLGGTPAVTAVVDAFLKRVAADKRINGRFINTDLGRLRGLLIAFVTAASAGPAHYAGRDMHTSHAGLQIVDEEFDALVGDLAGALAELKVPKPEQDQLLGALGPLKPQIVNPPPAAAGQHDPALAERATATAAELRAAGSQGAADLLEGAVRARVRGQRSYADQLYSAAEQALPAGRLAALNPLFREGAPERITTELKTLPQDTPPQPKLAVGGDEEPAAETPRRATLSGSMKIEQGDDVLGVIALDPVGGRAPRRTPKQRIMEQRDRQFAPRLLAIPVGSTVTFPNFDSVYHNVFSLSPARAFDLGLYRNGEARDVTFKKEGLVRLGCNLHANMSAHVVVVAAPHYVVTEPGGRFRFRSLAPGKYKVRAWSENSSEPVTRTIELHAGENTLDLSIPRGAPSDLGTDKFGVPRGEKG